MSSSSFPITLRAAFAGFLLLPATLVASAQSGGRPPVSAPPRTSATPAASAPAVADSAKPAAPAFATVVGTVYDSVHAAPLSNATVLLEGFTRLGLTNGRGGFAIDSVPAGTYRLRVEHVLLDSLGLQMVTQPFALTDGENRTVALSVPSSESLVGVSCPAARRQLGPSAIIGRLLDADTDAPVQGAKVSFAWSEISITAGLRRVPRLRDALSGEDGVYRICGLPNEVEGTLQAIKGPITTAEVTLRLQGEPLVIQGMRIGNAQTVAKNESDSAKRRAEDAQATGPRFSAVNLQRGQAVLRGRVVGANGQPIIGARVDVEGTASRALTKEGGEFTLTELPSGTQKVVAMQLGYEPVQKAVELSTRAPAQVTITMSRPATVLERVVVKAEEDRGLERVGFDQRKRGLSGTFITGEEVMKRGPNQLTDVFRTVPMLRVVPGGNNEYVVESARSTGLGANCVKVWLDAAPFDPAFPGDIDRLIAPWNVGAVEVYNGSSAPMQFQAAGSSACTVIVIWSKYKLGQGAPKR